MLSQTTNFNSAGQARSFIRTYNIATVLAAATFVVTSILLASEAVRQDEEVILLGLSALLFIVPFIGITWRGICKMRLPAWYIVFSVLFVPISWIVLYLLIVGTLKKELATASSTENETSTESNFPLGAKIATGVVALALVGAISIMVYESSTYVPIDYSTPTSAVSTTTYNEGPQSYNAWFPADATTDQAQSFFDGTMTLTHAVTAEGDTYVIYAMPTTATADELMDSYFSYMTRVAETNGLAAQISEKTPVTIQGLSGIELKMNIAPTDPASTKPAEFVIVTTVANGASAFALVTVTPKTHESAATSVYREQFVPNFGINN